MHSIPGGGDGKKIEPKKICWGMGGSISSIPYSGKCTK